MYFLQKDDIMLHFTLSGSSASLVINVYFLVYFLVYFFVYLESVMGFKFGFKLGYKFGSKLNLNWKEWFHQIQITKSDFS